MSLASSLLVRLVHVVGMAFVFGSAVFAWAVFRADGDVPHSLATTYEWLFWATMGVMVVTGVGNLGALGPPGPETRWGSILTVKLVVVLAFVVGSFLRTLVVLRLRERAMQNGALLSKLYAATAGGLLVLVTLAEVLAHG
ncbi:hypothetical protein ACFQJC_08940 [Haloferax namakaokahaiae]|uniref:Copper resistance protein D domain-containing protein n=1 Tax=Haloferax namakaokahaiae TaxID=1748331 RepID=A0ABD5ZET2_9EURY